MRRALVPEPARVQAYLAACHAHAGRLYAAGSSAAAGLHASCLDFSFTRFTAKEPFRRPEDAERLVRSMRLAGLPE
jgi:hypothetical protein